MHTQADQLSNPQSPFIISRGAPAGYTTQQGYPLAPVSPQHGITSQPYITSTGGRNSLHCDIVCVIIICLLLTLGMTAVSPVQGSGIGASEAVSGSPGRFDLATFLKSRVCVLQPKGDYIIIIICLSLLL